MLILLFNSSTQQKIIFPFVKCISTNSSTKTFCRHAAWNIQTMEFSEWYNQLADGSTMTAANVAAVMKQLEKRQPTILGQNIKMVCLLESLTVRPKISGSVTQNEQKERLTAKKTT